MPDGFGHSVINRYQPGEHGKRPWGTWRVLATGPGFAVKRIEVGPGQKLSLQSHARRSEQLTVVAGCAEVTRGDQHGRLHEGGSMAFPIGTPHRVENPGAEPLVLIEVQLGDYLAEDDIVRLDDAYGRTFSAC